MEEQNIPIPEIVLLSVQSDDGYFAAFFKLHGGRPMVEVFHDLEGRRFAVGIEPRYADFKSFQNCFYRRFKDRNPSKLGKRRR